MMIMQHKVSCSFLSLFLLFSVSLHSCFLMGGLKIGSLNMNGGRDRNKRALVAEVAEQKRIDVLFLQETQ